jgi:hypothetical protein
MATVTAPFDGRKQFTELQIMMGNAMMGGGRMPLEGAEPVGYGSGLYTLAGEWPTPAKTNSYGSGQTLPPLEPVQEAPRTPARALWPNLK